LSPPYISLDGKKYVSGKDEIMPPQVDRPDCNFAWADQVIYRFGWQNDQAIETLSQPLIMA